MVLPEFGASVLKHELAHVFAAGLTDSPLGVPLRHGLVPDALLIEGVAMAAEWPLHEGLDLHQWAAAMRRSAEGRSGLGKSYRVTPGSLDIKVPVSSTGGGEGNCGALFGGGAWHTDS